MSDSDSEWLPPPQKKRKLNNKKAQSKTKKKTETRKRNRKVKKTQTKKRKRKAKTRILRHRSYKHNSKSRCNDADEDSDIEILCNKNKKKQQKRRKVKKKPRKSLKLRAVSPTVRNISNMDALMCGFYRSHSNASSVHITIPTDITGLISKYQQNILYTQVNFVWTHTNAAQTIIIALISKTIADRIYLKEIQTTHLTEMRSKSLLLN
eukprot:606723_1